MGDLGLDGKTGGMVSIIIPAWNEEARLGATIAALRQMTEGGGMQAPQGRVQQIVVVDDGSVDRTFAVAQQAADLALRHERRRGKGEALRTGWQAASGDLLLFADADLGESAVHLLRLLEPVAAGRADMAIARFPKPDQPAGFGFVKRLAAAGIYRLCGYEASAPLSGQRAVRRELLERIGPLAAGFGIEVGLTIDAIRWGYRIEEIELPLTHRAMGRDWRGFFHRGKQLAAVMKTLAYKWKVRG
jgi:glycosyltransferase involved in cell wall biosynthesis